VPKYNINDLSETAKSKPIYKPAPTPKPHVKPPPAPSPTHPAAAVARAVIDNADRNGLKWTLKLATVTSDQNNTNPNRVTARYDGDSGGVTMLSAIGVPAAGSRVMCIQVPPSGNFIIGNVQGTCMSQLTSRTEVRLQSDFTPLTAVNQNIITTNILIAGGFAWKVTGFFDFSMSVAGTTQGWGFLSGPNGLEQAITTFGMAATSDRACVSQVWTGVTANNGASGFTFTLQGRLSVASGTVKLNAFNTSMLVEIYQ
jgi:hypothetical protein